MKKRWLVISLLFLLIGLFSGQTVHAAGAGFTIDAIKSDNQISNSQFFDLKVSPNQVQDISLQVTNLENHAIKVKISPNPAYTNQNGIIEYSQHDHPKDSSAKYTLQQLFSEPQEVLLNPQESKEVIFQLKLPEEPFDGSILGGFYAQEVDGENDSTMQTTEQKATLSIKNEYSLVLGISLTEDPNQKVSPDLKLNEVSAGLAEERTAVLANLQNIQPKAFGEMTVDAKVYKKGDSKVFKETKKKNQEMAPNSNYNFVVSWNNESLEAGDYHLKLEATSGSKAWRLERDFTIEAKQAKLINQKAVDLPERNYWWLLIVLLVIILFVLVYTLGKRKGKQGSR